MSYMIGQVHGIAPHLLPLAGLSGALALWRRDPRVLAVVAVMGGVLIFSAWAFLTARSFGWLRFYIALIPMTLLLGGLAVSTQGRGWLPIPGWLSISSRAAKLGQLGGRTLVFGVVVILLVQGIAGSVLTMLDPRLSREEAYSVQSWLRGPDRQAPLPDQSSIAGRAVVQYLDGLTLPDGSVLVDVATGFSIVLQSDRPKQFVITPDRDFPASLADPRAFGIQYLLVHANNPLDAVGRTHGLGASTNPSLGDLVREFRVGGITWRLFAVRDPIIKATEP